jgi:hypothetical protein
MEVIGQVHSAGVLPPVKNSKMLIGPKVVLGILETGKNFYLA